VSELFATRREQAKATREATSSLWLPMPFLSEEDEDEKRDDSG